MIVVTGEEAGRLEVRTLRDDGDRTTLSLGGELDLSSGELLAAVLSNHLAMGDRWMRLDMSRVTFLDCAGLRTLVYAHNQFLGSGGSLVLTGVGPRIVRLLRLSHLDEALRVETAPTTESLSRLTAV
jgi:anti-anti-sigma factor